MYLIHSILCNESTAFALPRAKTQLGSAFCPARRASFQVAGRSRKPLTINILYFALPVLCFMKPFFKAGVYCAVPIGNKTNKHKKTVDMKKLLLIILTLGFAGSLALNAADAPKKKGMTAEQKKLYKEMVEKYDENKNGRLDKAERSKMSAEDQKKMEEAGIGGKKKKAE